jgi:SAM-dependent methyltransferase
MTLAPEHDPAITAGSVSRFGYEWHHYPELRPEYEEQFRRWAVHLAPEDWRDLRFLDVGCGMGRNSYWAMRYGAAEGVAIDMDDRSLASARRILAGFPGMRVEKASAYAIPYRNMFDVVFSIGVVHHLEHPERALAQMVQAARPGGRVLIWVYGQENNRWIAVLVDPVRKALFSRLPVAVVHHLAFYPTALLWLGVRLGIGRIDYFRMLRSFAFRHLRSIVFDQMLPKIAHYWPREAVEALLSAQGLQDITLAWVNEMSWSAIGTKPLADG